MVLMGPSAAGCCQEEEEKKTAPVRRWEEAKEKIHTDIGLRQTINKCY
jgi:hypothetical protein